MKALSLDPDLSGEAWYRSERYDNALGAWSQRDTAQALYNQGNALAHLGQYEAAIQAYDQALEKQPDMEDAEFNRALVEQLKEKQELLMKIVSVLHESGGRVRIIDDLKGASGC